MVRRLNTFIKAIETFSGPEEVKKLRQRVIKELDETDWSDLYDPRDVQRLKDDDYFCKRILRHRSGNIDASVEIIKTVFKWRKEFGIHDLKEVDIDSDIISKGAVFTYNEDKEGNPILILRVNCHRKDPATVIERKKIICYWTEKLEREIKDGSMSVLLDCSDTGLVNVDVEFTLFLMKLFAINYPAFVDHIYVFDMPWIMNACWKVIKKILPKEAADRIKFLSTTSFTDFFDAKSLPPHLGGTCLKEYKPMQFSNFTEEECLSCVGKDSTSITKEERERKA